MRIGLILYRFWVLSLLAVAFRLLIDFDPPWWGAASLGVINGVIAIASEAKRKA